MTELDADGKHLLDVSKGYIHHEIIALLELENEIVNAALTGSLEKLRDMLFFDDTKYYMRNTQRRYWRGSLLASGMVSRLKLEEKDIKKK